MLKETDPIMLWETGCIFQIGDETAVLDVKFNQELYDENNFTSGNSKTMMISVYIPSDSQEKYTKENSKTTQFIQQQLETSVDHWYFLKQLN